MNRRQVLYWRICRRCLVNKKPEAPSAVTPPRPCNLVRGGDPLTTDLYNCEGSTSQRMSVQHVLLHALRKLSHETLKVGANAAARTCACEVRPCSPSGGTLAKAVKEHPSQLYCPAKPQTNRHCNQQSHSLEVSEGSKRKNALVFAASLPSFNVSRSMLASTKL